MDRDTWIMAASLLDRHGTSALAVVHNRLSTLAAAIQASPSAEDVAVLSFWRQIALAILAIVEPKPAGPQSVN